MLNQTTKTCFYCALVFPYLAIFDACNASDPKVAFDIPSKVECRDVTPAKCALAHPTMKVIEAKFRISASLVNGVEESNVEFVYMISNPDMRLKVLDFLPNTTLESSTAEDRIEVTDNTESTDAATGDTRVGYGVLSLGLSKNVSSKKTESNRYQRVAPKNLVLASGTVNRGNGVFYKLKPSIDGSLEGAKEFVVLCVVPKTWRGDWCTVICSARVGKKTNYSSSSAIAGIEQAHVGLYLSGDREASELADTLTEIQVANGGLLAKQLAKDAQRAVEDLHAGQLMHSSTEQQSTDWPYRLVKFKPTSKQNSIESSKKSLVEIEHKFSELASAAGNLH